MDSYRIPGDPRPVVAGPATDRATCVLAPNANAMTLDGTNTWLLLEPGADRAAVIDPGPLHEGHLRAVLAAAEERGARVAEILLTHGHPDHSEGAARLAELAGCGVRALDPAHRLGGEGLVEGDVVTTGGLELRVIATPGHSWDSLSFVLPADDVVLTGDTILGRGTTVVAHPEGTLGDYLDSLARLRALVDAGEVSRVLPAHGPVLDDARGVVEFYLEHRAQRLVQVEQAMALGDRTAREVVERVYANVDQSLWWAAEMSVRAQMDYLQKRGPRT
ncbi:MBL fold metallo-hydrolase [Yinghuangia soli]|uniref:MBL fold metallo-hydrolase n=1 Tax=Yinghuangia soli TaxID=2908204 RepID=A0AA41Q1U4_9ACTN|nr:MBL fold metallo-hydrolase [Yinghuangia soli]MCF2529206.1 MBL fold metallo-hydrolase [Yinghuangia soli]